MPEYMADLRIEAASITEAAHRVQVDDRSKGLLFNANSIRYVKLD